MIIDSHCHAWTHWPYQPAVPDPKSRGKVEQLLNEMELHGVDKALIVCAQIEHNPDNNQYIADQVSAHPGRLYMLADLDSSWSSTYHLPGAVDRLARMLDQWSLSGFTHYLRSNDDGSWLYSPEGIRLFSYAAKKSLIASLSCQPHHIESILTVARQFPSIPILIHHMGHVMDDRVNHDSISLKQVLKVADQDNVYIKVSGFAYAAEVKWDFPYERTHWILKALYEHFGPQRLCWGSDYPVVRFFMTYRQALEVLRSHCDFISETDKAWILGESLETILSRQSTQKT